MLQGILKLIRKSQTQNVNDKYIQKQHHVLVLVKGVEDNKRQCCNFGNIGNKH